jgi:pyruvate,water dikinase
MESLIVPLDASDAADPARFGPKAANLALLCAAGLPTPGGYAVDAGAYRAQLAALGLEATAREVFAADDRPRARRCALDMKLGLMDSPVAPQLADPLLSTWRGVTASGGQGVVRSSALVEDRADSSFAGQFESFLELQNEQEFLVAVRSCWAALWSTRALRYMATHGLDPADTAMGLIVQPLVAARVSGGGLSRTSDGDRVINAAPGLGSAIAQARSRPNATCSAATACSANRRSAASITASPARTAGRRCRARSRAAAAWAASRSRSWVSS